MFRRLSFAAVGIVGALLVGCGQSSGPSLSGVVTYNGEPVANGAITFASTGQGNSFGAIISEGKYEAPKPMEGEFTVLVRASSMGPAPKTREEAEAQMKAAVAKGITTSNYIPDTAEGNQKTVQISSGSQTIDFALTGPPRK